MKMKQTLAEQAKGNRAGQPKSNPIKKQARIYIEHEFIFIYLFVKCNPHDQDLMPGYETG